MATRQDFPDIDLIAQWARQASAGDGDAHPAGVAIDPKAGEVFVTDGVRNGLFTFLAPKFFCKESPSKPADNTQSITERKK